MTIATCRRTAFLAPIVAIGFVGLIFGCNDGPMTFAPARAGEDIWAIRVVATADGDHERAANAYADALRKVTGLSARLVRVVHDAGVSKVYYGRYRREYDAATDRASFRPDHHGDLRTIRGLTLGPGGGRPFAMALPELLPMPSDHPEWDLARQTGGYFSLNVGVFYNEGKMNQRRKAAQEYCADLRRRGEQAFFHHGPVKSSVCIGLFPRSALETIDRTDPRTGTATRGMIYADPRLVALQKKYPHNLENGHIINQVVRDPLTQKIVKRTPNVSFVVRVPQSVTRSIGP